MKGKTSVTMLGVNDFEKFEHSGMAQGPLKLPKGTDVNGELVAFGEDENYIHCVISNTGVYYGVFKCKESNHLYGKLLELNT